MPKGSFTPSLVSKTGQRTDSPPKVCALVSCRHFHQKMFGFRVKDGAKTGFRQAVHRGTQVEHSLCAFSSGTVAWTPRSLRSPNPPLLVRNCHWQIWEFRELMVR